MFGFTGPRAGRLHGSQDLGILLGPWRTLAGSSGGISSWCFGPSWLNASPSSLQQPWGLEGASKNMFLGGASPPETGHLGRRRWRSVVVVYAFLLGCLRTPRTVTKRVHLAKSLRHHTRLVTSDHVVTLNAGMPLESKKATVDDSKANSPPV